MHIWWPSAAAPLHEVDALAVDAIAHGEKRCLGPVLGQHVEHGGSGFGPGAVVEREGHHLVVAHVGRYVAPHHVDGLLRHLFGGDPGHRAGFRALHAVGALALDQVDGPAALFLVGEGNGGLNRFRRLLQGAAVAQFHHISAGQLRIGVSCGLAVDGGVERFALAFLQHRAVHGHEVARLRLDAAGVQRVAQRFAAAHVDARSVQRDGGGQALHDEVRPDAEGDQHQQADHDAESAAPRAFRLRLHATIAIEVLVGRSGVARRRRRPGARTCRSGSVVGFVRAHEIGTARLVATALARWKQVVETALGHTPSLKRRIAFMCVPHRAAVPLTYRTSMLLSNNRWVKNSVSLLLIEEGDRLMRGYSACRPACDRPEICMEGRCQCGQGRRAGRGRTTILNAT